MQWCSNLVVWHVIFPVLLMQRQYLQFTVLQKLNPISFVAEPCLLVRLVPLKLGVDGPRSGAASVVLVTGFRIRKSMMGHCICRCGTVVADVPGFFGQSSGQFKMVDYIIYDVCIENQLIYMSFQSMLNA